MVLAECLFTKRPIVLIIRTQSLRFTEVYGVPRKIFLNWEVDKNDKSVILGKWSCGKVRMLSKHLSQKVSGPYPFLGEFPEKQNNQKIFDWVSILTSPYKGF